MVGSWGSGLEVRPQAALDKTGENETAGSRSLQENTMLVYPCSGKAGPFLALPNHAPQPEGIGAL